MLSNNNSKFLALAAAHNILLLLLLLSHNYYYAEAFFIKVGVPSIPRATIISTTAAANKLHVKVGSDGGGGGGGGGGGIDAYAAQMAAMMAGGGGSPNNNPSSPQSATDDTVTVDAIAADMLNLSRGQSNAAAIMAATSTTATTATSSSITTTTTTSADNDVTNNNIFYLALVASQTRVMEQITSSIPDLVFKPDLSIVVAANNEFTTTIADNPVRLNAYDAPGPANIAWLSDLSIENTLSSLTIFNGPLTDVPHLISRCAILQLPPDKKTHTLHLFIDFRPRAYGAYDLRDVDNGNYPGPDTLGRKAFEYSGARKVFESKFGTEDVVKFYNDIKSQLLLDDGAYENPGLGDMRLSELEKITRGPMAIDMTIPLSAKNVDIVISAREKAASLWLKWALDSSHSHRPGAPINSQYVYDSKYKINAYRVLLDVYVKLYGPSDGEKLAAADSGPIDEAYVGGGS